MSSAVTRSAQEDDPGHLVQTTLDPADRFLDPIVAVAGGTSALRVALLDLARETVSSVRDQVRARSDGG